MINEDRKKLYDALSSEYDLGTYEEFERNIGDSTKRRKLYDAASADYDLGDFESYSKRIGPTHKESLDAFNMEYGSFLDDFEARDTAEMKNSRAGMSSGIYIPTEGAITGEERQRYMDLHKQEEALKKAWYTSDEYLAQKDAEALQLAQMRKDITNGRLAYAQANPMIEGINPSATRGPEADKELQMYETASRIMDDAIKMHNAPSKYDGTNVFGKFAKGAGSTLSDLDFWSMGLTEITGNLGVRDVLSTVQKKLGNLNDLSEEAIEDILTPAEKAVLQAWAMNTQEQLKRKDDLSRGYQAGRGAVESLGFMAEFALTGGVGKAATEGVESMAKWLGKKALTTIGGKTDDVAEKIIKETGEKIASNTVGKYATGLAESLAEAAGRTGVMPSTFRNISEKATEIQTDEDGNNYLIGMNNAFARGLADSFIETLSEGGRVNALGELFGDVAGKIPAYRKMVDRLSNTKASELWNAFNSSGIMNTLRAGGWHGLGEEYLEEWYGNTLRTLTGVDKDALRDFATVDNQIITLTSFLPMTIFGGTVSTAQVLSASRDLEKKAGALKTALLERGYDEAQADNMIDIMRGATPAEVSNILTPIVNSVAGRSVNEASALMKPVGEFAQAVQRWQSFDTKYQYQEQEQRDNLRAQMEETLGQFWQEDEDGRQTVQRGVNENGESVYLLGKPSVEEAESGIASEVAAITSDGRKVFVNPAEYQLEDELEMNDFLGVEIMAEKRNREQARMIEEKEAKIEAIREQSVPGTAINIGTAEAPVQAIIIQRDPDGVIVNTPDGQTRQMTYEELGNYVGINTAPMTDAQIDEQEADALTADRAQREASLDQEYGNDEEAISELTEAEDAIEQSVAEATPLPLKADGSVDQTALWNENPERWAEWNDEQRQDGGLNSLAYINGAIAKESARIAEMQAGYDTISDFDERDAVEREVAAIRERLQRLVNLRDIYVAQAEAVQAVAEEVAAEQVAPRISSQMSEEEKVQMDTQYENILRQTRTKTERVRLLQEYVNKISEGSMPAVVITKDNFKEAMRAAGCSEALIARVEFFVKAGQNIGAFIANGHIFLMEDGLPSMEEARISYVHERQHAFNSSRSEFVQKVVEAVNGNRGILLGWLSTFVDAKSLETYKDDNAFRLADEVIARCMEIAYTTEEFSVDLQSRGIPSEVISTIIEIDNEQRFTQSYLNARRGTRRTSYDNVSGLSNMSEDGRNLEQVSGGILEQQETRSSSTGDGRARAGQAGEGAEVISEEQLNAPNSGEAQQITAADGEVLADTDGKGGVRFSIRTWNEGGRDYLAAWLANDTTLTEDEKADILARMDEFYQNALLYSDTYVPFGTWSEAGVRYDNNGNPLMSVIKANGDYAMNLDFSLVCKKRRPLNRLLRTLINRNAFGSYTLKEREIAEINWILQEHGFEVACALCFVDSKRYRVTGVADVFASLYNRLVKALAPAGVQIDHFNYNNNPNVDKVENGLDTMADDQLNWDRFDMLLSAYKPGSVEHKVAQYLREHPEARKLVDATDFIEAEGFESVKENNPDLLKFYNMKKGTGGPKASFGDVQYLNDILKKEKSFDAEKAYAVGGVRLQSFSDFVPHMYFDYMQLFAELAAKKLPLHAYTKEVLFAKIFGLTGAKINMSLVPAVVEGGIAPGLDAEGNYAWADPVTDAEGNVIQQGQSFPYDEAMAIQNAEGYSKNCGVIAVGISDEHIEKMLDDPNIPFIIPYHKSSLNAIVARMTNIDQYKDYTNVQNTRKASGSKLDKGTKDFNFNEYLHGLGESGTPQQAAQAYLDWCRENKFIPKFSQFAYHPNYYKLLQDFNTIDLTTGEYAPQGAVTMTFPTEQGVFGNVESLIQQGLQEDAELEEKMELEIDGIADQVLSRLEEISKEPKVSEKQQAKKMAELADERMARIQEKASGPIDLVEEARKADLRHRVTAEGTLIPGHKKGKPMLSDAEMMGDAISFRITKNTKTTIESWCDKAGLDEDTKIGFIDHLEFTFDDATEQLCAAKWYLSGKINLPNEDEYKVRDAVKVAKRNKVDALTYESPMDILNTFGQPKEKVKPINPDNVPTLKNRTEVPDTDIVIYDVEESEESRKNMREIINTHYGKNASPWCVLQGNEFGELTPESKGHWEHYSAYPKQVAFKGGKLLAFNANSAKNITWWDRLDKPYEGIPVMEKLNDEANRRATSVINPKTGKQIRLADVHSRTEKDGYTIIRNWEGIDGPMLSAQKRKGEALIAQFNRYTEEDFATNLQYWFAGRPNGLDQVYTQEKTISFSPNGELETYYVEGYRLSYNRFGSATWLVTTRTPVIQEYGFNRKGRLVSFFSGTELITNRKRLAEVEVPDEYKALVGRNPKSFMAEAEQLVIEAGLAEAYEESSVRFRITPEQDKAYMDAVEAGDMETAQRMVDEAAAAAGYTIRGDHGRVSKFTIFDRNKANPEGNWGQGFYFTNNEDDVENNYASVEGPDLEAKIEREVERRVNLAEMNEEFNEDGEVDEFAIREAVEDEFITSEPNVVHAAIKMDNPFVVGHGMVEIGEDGLGHYDMQETYLTAEYETDEDDEIDYDVEPTGTLVDLVEALSDELSGYEWANVSANEILANNFDGMTAGQFEKEARELLSPYIDSLVNDNGEIMSSEIIRAAIERAGFDGIVDNTVNQKFGTARRYGRAMEGMDENTRHYIAFQSSQIKETDPVTYDDNGNVIPLSERFNPENEDIRFSIIGERGAMNDKTEEGLTRLANLETARQMESQLNPDWSAKDDENALKIKVATGWERGADGKWRYEVDDIKAKPFADWLHSKKKLKLKDVVEPNIVLDMYPEIGEITIKKGTSKTDWGAVYYDETKEIKLPFGALKYLIELDEMYEGRAYSVSRKLEDCKTEMLSDIIHEVQHAIQHKEGFAQGGNEDMILPKDKEEYKNRWNEFVNLASEYNALSNWDRTSFFGQNLRSRAYEARRRANDLKIGDAGYRKLAGEVEAYNTGNRMNMSPEERRNSLLASTEDVARKDQIFLMDAVDSAESSIRFRTSNNNQAIFVSNAARAVEGIKQEKATPEQWLKMIEKNGGLKAGEDKWMGLSDWLKASDKKTLTKQEVLDFINENMIIIEEQRYGEIDEEAAVGALVEENASRLVDGLTLEELQEQIDEHAESASRYDEEYDNPDFNLDVWLMNIMIDEYGHDFSMYYSIEDGYVGYAETDWWDSLPSDIALEGVDGVRAINETRKSYTTRGLTNLHEIALTIPTIESWGESDMVHFGDAGDGRAIAWIRFGETEVPTGEYATLLNEVNRLKEVARELYEEFGGRTNEIAEIEERRKELEYEMRNYENPGKKVLVIDEIQSKRHQEGREKGYRVANIDKWLKDNNVEVIETGEFFEFIKDGQTDRRFSKGLMRYDIEKAKRLYVNGFAKTDVPDAPFDKNWHELAMKRMLRYAAENGYDVIAWTTGDQQNQRYALGGVVSSIEMAEEHDGFVDFLFNVKGEEESSLIGVKKESGIVHLAEEPLSMAEGKPLAELVGKEVAERMMQMKESEVLDADNLRIGGEGMKGFYDKMLPAFMNKYGKKWGVKVEDIELPNLEDGLTMHSVPVTEEMKASVMEGQVMFRVRGENESAMEFHQSVVDEYLRKYNDIAAMEVFPVDEATAKRFGYTLDQLKKLSGLYDSSEDLIAIFAKEEETDSIEVEDTIFHESVHKLVNFFDYLKEVGEWMWSVADKYKVFADIKKRIEQEYSEDEYAEEMMCFMLGGVMPRGLADGLLYGMPEHIRKQCEQIFNEIGYDSTRESIARLLGQNGESAVVSGMASEENRTDEGRRRSEKEQEGSVRFRATELTPEEKRKVNELFPGAFKVTDSKGNTLTPAQERFFANSKAVDKDGNLLTLYHGTPRAGFTEFKSGWFTTSKEDAISYSGDRKGRLFDPNEKYEPETLTAGDFRLGYMTFDSEEDRAAFLERFPYANEVMSEEDYESARLGADEEYDALTARRKEFAEVWNAYREYERERFVDTTIGDLIANPEAYTEDDLRRAMLAYDSNASFDSLDDMDATERKDALVSALQNADEETEGGIADIMVATRVPRNGEGQKHNDLGNRTYEVYANIEKPYEIDANGRGSEFESGDIYKAVEEALADEQYDGVIIRNWRVGRTQQLGDVVVPKNGSQIKLTSNENPTESSDIQFRITEEGEDPDIRFSIRTKPAPKKTDKGYKVFYLKDGKLYPPMVANLGGVDTPVLVWLDADAAPQAATSKTGRKKVKAGGKGTQGGSGTLAYRPGWHLGKIPYALQFNRGPKVDNPLGITGKNGKVIQVGKYFPANFVWAEVEYANEVDYQDEAMSYGYNEAGNFQHSLAGLPKVPEDGSYIYRTNANPATDPWIITGAMKVTRLLTPSEVDQMVIDAGREPQERQEGAVTDEQIKALNKELGLVEEEVSFRVTGTPTEDVVAKGVSLSPAQLASLAGDIFSALPEDSRKKITDGLNGNILGLQDAILQIPTSLASKESWDEEDRQMADIVAEEMTKMAGDMTRPFSAPEGLWLLYNNLNKNTDLVSQASRALVQRNLGFDEATQDTIDGAKDGVRFRTVGDARANATASMYNRGAANVWTRLKESYVDMNASVEKLVKAIEKRSGKVAQGFENILMALNQQSSKGLAAMESYTQRFLNPMFDAIRKIMDVTDFKYENIVRYVILKHGIERNKKLAQRDAKAHYQEIYDDIIAKIKGMNTAQKRTYLTNAQLRDADAKAELARLQSVNTSALTPDQMRDHKKELAKAKKEAAEAAEHLVRAQKIATMTEQDTLDELDKIFKKIEKGTDSVYKEMRKNDYSGISSMFYDQLGVDRKNYSTEEEYQAALMQAKSDKYDSLADIEAAAEREVTNFESLVNTDDLWKSINKATKETLRQQYEANMISKDQYENLRDMFEYYVPLRGFKDNTAEDMYTYYRKPNSTGYTKPILGAEGRKTEAESPFGWIASMAGSAIASNVKNEAKLALYYFVANRPDNGVATLSRTWFVHTPGDVDANGKKIFRPAYPPFNEDLSSDAAKQAYEDWQEQMRDLQKQGLAYESGQRLNLGNSVVNIDQKNRPEHIVSVKVGGKDYTIVINGNPRAAQAINGDLNIEAVQSDYSALFGPVLRWMSSVNTSYNPEFWITNMMRDMAFTMMAVNIKEDPVYRRKFKKNYAKAFKVISMVAKNEKGTIGDSYIETMYKDFVKYGGVTGYTQIKDSETWEKEIENYLKSNDPERAKLGKAMRGVKSVFHVAHRFGESLEQVSRFAAFLTARETGKSINEAVNDAKEITVNFNRKGSGKMITLEEAKYLTGKDGQPLTKAQQWMAVGASSIAPLGRRFIMFFNAAIQGLNATYKLYAKNKTRAIGWALGYAAVGMMNAVLHAMLDDDDDYLDIPQYERRNSLMIGGNGAYFKWALPQEARAFYALGDLAVESVMGRNPHQNVVGEALKISTEILPVNPAEGWKAFMPSVAIPFIELALNEDYKGAPVYNEQKWLSEEERERTAKWSKAYQGTGKVYKDLAQGLNYITGGDEHDAGFINLQPEKIEHIVQSAFGGTVRTADKFISTIMAAIDPEEDVTIRQTPFLNRFLTINDERFKNVHVNDVYDYYKADAEHALTLEKKYIKDKDADALRELRDSDEYRWAQIYGKYKKPIQNIQEKIKVADGTSERKELMKQQDELKRRMIKEISEL